MPSRLVCNVVHRSTVKSHIFPITIHTQGKPEKEREDERKREEQQEERRVPLRRGRKEVAQAPRSSSRSPARSLQGENAPWHGWISGRSSRRSKSGDAGQEWDVRQNRKLHIRAKPMVRE